MRKRVLAWSTTVLMALAAVAFASPTPTTVPVTLGNKVKLTGAAPNIAPATATTWTVGKAGVTTNIVGTLQSNGAAVGGAATLAALYAAGTTTAHSTLALDATRGPMVLKYDAVGVDTTGAFTALTLVNTTAATAGNQQWSPPLTLKGNYFSTTSKVAEWKLQGRPVIGSDVNVNGVMLSQSLNAAAFVDFMSFTNDYNVATVSGGATIPGLQLRPAPGDNAAQIGINGSPGVIYFRAGGAYVMMMDSAGIHPQTAGSTPLGTAALPWQGVVIGDVAANRPACAVGQRGKLWTTQGPSGTTDTLYHCMKSTADTYSWVSIATGG